MIAWSKKYLKNSKVRRGLYFNLSSLAYKRQRDKDFSTAEPQKRIVVGNEATDDLLRQVGVKGSAHARNMGPAFDIIQCHKTRSGKFPRKQHRRR